MKRYSMFALLLAVALGLSYAVAFAAPGNTASKLKSTCGCVDCKCPDCNGQFCSCDVCECGSCGCASQSATAAKAPGKGRCAVNSLTTAAFANRSTECVCTSCEGDACGCEVCECIVCGCAA